jgi:hypothetical protein
VSVELIDGFSAQGHLASSSYSFPSRTPLESGIFSAETAYFRQRRHIFGELSCARDGSARISPLCTLRDTSPAPVPTVHFGLLHERMKNGVDILHADLRGAGADRLFIMKSYFIPLAIQE